MFKTDPELQPRTWRSNSVSKSCLQRELRLDVVVASCAFGMGIDWCGGHGEALGSLKQPKSGLNHEKKCFYRTTMRKHIWVYLAI